MVQFNLLPAVKVEYMKAVRTKRLRAAKHVKATRAALVMLRAVGLQSKARHTGDAKLAAAAVAGYRAALAIDHAFDPAWLVSALLRQALLQASETSKPLRAFIAKKGRRLSLTPLVYELLRHEHAGLAALRARPEIALALAELERTAHADATPTLHAWLLARLGRRSALEKKARAVFRHPLARLLADIALLADPNSEDERANVAALQAGAR